MPLYNFQCTNPKCKKSFDENVSLAEFDTKVVFCPKCKSKAERQITGLRTKSSTWGYWKQLLMDKKTKREKKIVRKFPYFDINPCRNCGRVVLVGRCCERPDIPSIVIKKSK